MSAAAYMAKAKQALDAARLLLAHGHTDAACNRAYYAMFDAARAALLIVQASAPAETVRTHSGLITAFGLQLVKSGRLDKEFGRSLNRAHELRLAADYSGDPTPGDQVVDLLLRAEAFVSAVAGLERL